MCLFPAHNMSCILCLPFIKFIAYANDVLDMYSVRVKLTLLHIYNYVQT